jgi:putative hydrolase of the HAD superfamily
LEAAHRAGVEPGNCAYVGDNLKRDVTGTRAAGFGMLVIMLSPKELAEAIITDDNRPDVIINEFRQLLDIFPGRK